MSLPLADGGATEIGEPAGRWRPLVVYRGRRCPRCRTYLNTLEVLYGDWRRAGLDVLSASADPGDHASADIGEFGWTFPVAHSLSDDSMRELSLNVSDPLSAEETDRRFAEPGVFCVRPDGPLQIIAISNGRATGPVLPNC